VKLILDTHTAIWWLSDDARLGTEALRQVGDERNQVLLSAAVIWEVAIKRSLGKLVAPEDLASVMLGAGALQLAVTLDHAAAVETLPWHHRDPFDRLLIAQALHEGAALVSNDARLSSYGAPIVW
jgi:PIN domain nuclease of toxin-antitoxin system